MSENVEVSRGSTKRLLSADLWPMLTTEHGSVRLKRFEERLVTPLDRLLESLVLYDEVVIPTQDFLIIPALINALGASSVCQLLDSGAIRLLRIKKMFAFTAGSGASVFTITRPSGKKHPFAQELDEILYWIAKDCVGSGDSKTFHTLLSSITTELDAEKFTSVIRDESESDVLQSAQIRDLFELPCTHPRDLPAPPNMVIMYGGPEMESENKLVQSYLRLVQSNVEVAIAAELDCNDISTATALDTILAEKFARSGYSDVISELYDLSDVPDFPPLIRARKFPLHTLIALRNSKDGEEFRKWFHENLSDGNSIAKAYVDLIKKVSPVDSVPAKILRVLVWTGISAGAGTVAGGPVGTMAGVGVGLAGGLLDAFAMNRLRLGGSAKVFLESFAKATIQKK